MVLRVLAGCDGGRRARVRRRAILIGCGTGNLVRAVSARAEVAEGIDADPAVIAIACRSPEIQPNMIFTVADLMNVAGGRRYDAVTAATEARVAMSARTAPAQTTLAEIRNVAARVLRGSRIRRRLFWRYSLTFTDLSTIEPALVPGKSRSAV